ncbi:MAG TPA: hypothetical protein PLS10_01275 [Chitinophagales bacterium]|nr:hypothetical protein [Chitinophagales bacterium]
MQPLFLEDITTFIKKFEDESLPKEQWTHEAHLATGLYYVYTYGKEQALDRIRINIKKYNIATGGENTATSGYHETITVFWIWVMDTFIKKESSSLSLRELLIQLLQSEYAITSLPFQFYSKDYLLSEEARKNFIEPDLKSLTL